MFRKEMRNAVGNAHWEVWAALCAGPMWKRLVLAARLACGRPRGVWGKA